MNWRPPKVRKLSDRLIEVALRVAPRRNHVVVYGIPPSEGNSIATSAALTRRYEGKVYVLVDEDLSDGTRWLLAPGATAIRKSSLRAILLYLTADVIFFTHGLYGRPLPPRNRVVVNLWHGDGFKVKMPPRGRRSDVPSTYIIGSTMLLTAKKGRDFAVPSARALPVGNPRNDFLFSDIGKQKLRAIGIERPYVVWMPTFRQARGIGRTAGWSDAPKGAEYIELTTLAQSVAAELNQRGYDLVVKPHVLDAESRSVPGVKVIDNDTLASGGLHLYEFLGASAGLITDFSSVWTDYLLLDRPIGFLAPDRSAYQASRGLEPDDVNDWLPGIHLDTVEDIRKFATELEDRGVTTADLRDRAASRLGLVRTSSATDDLLDALDHRDAFRFRLRPRNVK